MEVEKGKKRNRVIARYNGGIAGPLLIILGGVHGNEKAGIKAVRFVKKMLDVEPITKPQFRYRGNMVGLIGNVEANRKSHRFINRDLNRLWTDANVAVAYASDDHDIHEFRELRELHQSITEQVKRYKANEVVLLDLHTTSSDGGIFVIPSSSEESMVIAQQLHAPVIESILEGIEGTTLHYFNDRVIEGAKITALTFEAGQHQDPLSINRCIAAILSCMRAINAVDSQDIENIHDQMLIEYSTPLPDRCKFIYKHEILPGDDFKMLHGFANFQEVKKGQVIARDRHGDIAAKCDGRVLMPLYQLKGEDGFFIIEDKQEPNY